MVLVVAGGKKPPCFCRDHSAAEAVLNCLATKLNKALCQQVSHSESDKSPVLGSRSPDPGCRSQTQERGLALL